METATVAALTDQYLALLKTTLLKDFVPHLPGLLDLTRPADEQERKNISRAFAAFALSKICGISPLDAAAAVVDDFEDHGIDAIYYDGGNETIYLLQAKLKESEQFKQAEALALIQGAGLLMKQDFNTFNDNVKNRSLDLEDAFESCSHIQIVVAHVGSGISANAQEALDNFIAEQQDDDERVAAQIIDYDASRVMTDLSAAKAYDKVNVDLWVHKLTSVKDPRVTYFGLINVTDLVTLHENYGPALYVRNIRNFLGKTTEVNTAIRQTLKDSPDQFVYLNNGVTALCEDIEPKGQKASNGGRRKLKIRGFSIINGAQTIASSATFATENKVSDISSAKVSLTLIRAYSESEFGKAVTRARNHQNPVTLSNFAALDDQQERLRREMSHLGYHYAYKAEAPAVRGDDLSIRIEEAAQALAILQDDPRYVAWLKKEPGSLLDTSSDPYKTLFNSTLTAFELINIVTFSRYVQNRLASEVNAAAGAQRLTYKHGNYALAWILSKRLRQEVSSARLIDINKLAAAMSSPFDALRNFLWTKVEPLLVTKGPLAIFRNQTDTIPILRDLLIEHYALTADPVVGIRQAQVAPGEPYPLALFSYLTSKAPQITNVT